jgi:hypothetical protein
MDLDGLLDQVNSKETFLAFVAALRNDWEAARTEEHGWENGSIGAFLGAMQAWGDDSADRVPNSPDWRMFALIMYAGKFYE